MKSNHQPGVIEVWRPADFAQVELRRGFAVTWPVPRHWHEEYQLCYHHPTSDGRAATGRRSQDLTLDLSEHALASRIYHTLIYSVRNLISSIPST